MHPDVNGAEGTQRLLRRLPGEPAPYGFAEFERRAALPVAPPRSVATGRRIALGSLAAVTALAALVRLGEVPQRGAAETVELRAAPGPEDESLPPHAALAERWLASLPSEPAVVHVETRAAVMGIEDRIAQIDDLLGAAGDEQARRVLRRERMRLVGTLLEVRYAETLARDVP